MMKEIIRYNNYTSICCRRKREEKRKERGGQAQETRGTETNTQSHEKVSFI